MTVGLLIVPHFWDPVCVTLGISSLKAHAEQAGHQVTLFDYNTIPSVYRNQTNYFNMGKQMFPKWNNWNIERNGTEMLALHQLVYLFGKDSPQYKSWCAEILNMDGSPEGAFMDDLDIDKFDNLFEKMYREIQEILEKLLADVKPKVVGCSLYNSTWPGTLFILKKVKQYDPKIRTVVGGPGPIMGITSRVDEIKSFYDAHDFIDDYVIGEGEKIFLDILNDPEKPGSILSPATTKEGSFTDANLDFENLPLPDYGTLDVDQYVNLSVSSSRGCPFECSFCAETVFWKGFRTIKGPDMFDRVDTLAQKYNRQSIFICDSLSNHIITSLTDRTRDNNRTYKYDCYLRADAICTKDERVRKWAEGGLFRARLGMESASQRILDAMIKKTTVANMEAVLRTLSRNNILTSTLWIIGFPKETEEEFESTLRFIRENKNHIYQADAWLFQYHPDGLSGSEEMKKSGSKKRFSDDLNKLFAVTPYVIDEYISIEERFSRLERFVKEMETHSVPNPYTFVEWAKADKRWHDLGYEKPWNIMDSKSKLLKSTVVESPFPRL